MRRRRPAALLFAVAATWLVAGCGSSGGGTSAANTRNVTIALIDSGCKPAQMQLPAGPTTFKVTGGGAGNVTEFELLEGTHIVGEVENVTPGLERSFSVTLHAGRYTLSCPGGTTAGKGVLRVTGGAASKAPSATAQSAVATYRGYLEDQTAGLVARTQAFAAAVERGDLAASKRLYAQARVPYESVEPVAETFGSLDPDIDARAGDVSRSKWTGFHPIEQALWARGTTKGQSALAAGLLRNVRKLQAKVRNVKLEPAQIANGAVELLGEVSKSKITGEEERYSHIDLVDFAANVDGAKAAFNAVAVLARNRDKGLAGQIDRRFEQVDLALARHRRGDGFVPYGALTRPDIRALSQAIDALAEPLSRIPALLVA